MTFTNEFHGAEEYRHEVENYLQEMQEIAADFIADATAPREEVESLNEEELIDRAIDRGFVSPSQIDDGDFDPVALGERLGLNMVEDENGDFLWLGWKVIQ